MKKTMAILGGSEGFPPDFMEILMKQDLRLLFVSEETEDAGIKDLLKHLKVAAEIEFIKNRALKVFLSEE